MKIGIGSDHAGYEYKEILREILKNKGFEVNDLGTYSKEPYDYPDIAEIAGVAMQNEEIDRAILICGSGVGVCVAINKIPGMRAGICHDSYSAHQGVEHDDMNVLCLGGRIIGIELAKEIVEAFLSADFSGVERHQRRLNKVKAIEAKFLKEKNE